MQETEVAGTASSEVEKEWSKLVGSRVEGWRDGRWVSGGCVDQATSDDTVLWIAAEGSQTRKLYDKLAGYEVRLAPVPTMRTGGGS